MEHFFTSKSWTTFGCLTCLRILISLFTRSISLESFIMALSRILIAAFSFVMTLVPSLTFPKVPFPRVLPMRNSPI